MCVSCELSNVIQDYNPTSDNLTFSSCGRNGGTNGSSSSNISNSHRSCSSSGGGGRSSYQQ